MFGTGSGQALAVRRTNFSMATLLRVSSVCSGAGRFHDRCPTLDVFAHEGRELVWRVADRGCSFGFEPLAQDRIGEAGHDHPLWVVFDRFPATPRDRYT